MTQDGEVLAWARAEQSLVRLFGMDLIASVGNASPTPGTVRLGPVACPGDDKLTYRVEGCWQVPLAAERQLVTLRAVRDSWPALGLQLTGYHESADGSAIRLDGEDPRSGMTFTLQSSVPPHAVNILVRSRCAILPDGARPSPTLTVYE